MRAIPFQSVFRSDKTFAIALSFVAFLGLFEIGAVVFHYASQARASYRSTTPAVTVVAPTPVPVAAATPQPAFVPKPVAAIAKPPGAPVESLIEEARQLRERGDTTNALERLKQALQIDPKNAEVLAGMAMIYESIQLFDRSNETWHRVEDIGSSAGPLFELAQLKLKVGVPADNSNTHVTNSPSYNMEGIPEGSSFGVTELTPTVVQDPDADMHLTLRVGVKARENASIDFTKVKIQVFFYDTVDDARVVLTDADVSYEWLTPHHNWSDANPEILSVTYLRQKKDSASTSDAALTAAAAKVIPPMPGRRARVRKTPAHSEPAETGQRKYLGYIVRVYYRDQLQAVRADPNRLLNLFPPPFTAPTQ